MTTTRKSTNKSSAPDETPFERLSREGEQLLSEIVELGAADPFGLLNVDGISESFVKATEGLLANPEKLMKRHMLLWEQSLNLWQRAVAVSDSSDTNSGPEKPDPYALIREMHGTWAKWLEETYANIEGLDPNAQRKVAFYTQQMTAATAPENFIQTNADVLQETIATEGKSLSRGIENLRHDLANGGQIQMSDTDAFEVGQNLAATPGKIVFQNHLMQLIQYAPATKKARQRPLLIVPPWINKFYILDLSKKNSFVGHLVSQGITVFLISWINPDQSHAEVSFGDYMTDGILAARDAVLMATGEKDLNGLGYCVGGTLLSATLAYLTTKKDKTFRSATFLTTLADYKEAGDIAVFIDEDQIAKIESHMEEFGLFEGRFMATAFNMLRPRDLIWSFVINNYLKGQKPRAFDILYWNSDTTNLPAAMHSYYLRNMYLNNRLSTPGGIELDGVPIDLGTITIPTYFMAAEKDHLSPWKSAYIAPTLFGKKGRFTLAKSGHVAGVVNPPAAKKYGYWTNSKLPDSPDAWQKSATEHDGSWWPDWIRWLKRRSGEDMVARVPGDGGLTPFEDAPGSYVLKKND
jgi:polyhydroxyalkanoate synthase